MPRIFLQFLIVVILDHVHLLFSCCLCQTDIIEAFNSSSRYLGDLLNIDTPYFDQKVGQIYPTELHSNEANTSDTYFFLFFDLNFSITNGTVSY